MLLTLLPALTTLSLLPTALTHPQPTPTLSNTTTCTPHLPLTISAYLLFFDIYRTYSPEVSTHTTSNIYFRLSGSTYPPPGPLIGPYDCSKLGFDVEPVEFFTADNVFDCIKPFEPPAPAPTLTRFSWDIEEGFEEGLAGVGARSAVLGLERHVACEGREYVARGQQRVELGCEKIVDGMERTTSVRCSAPLNLVVTGPLEPVE